MIFNKLLSKPLVKGILKSLPIVGEVVTNVDNENKAKKGQLDLEELGQAIIRLVILISIIIGALSIEDAESIKDIIK
jgi:hypothetical protein